MGEHYDAFLKVINNDKIMSDTYLRNNKNAQEYYKDLASRTHVVECDMDVHEIMDALNFSKTQYMNFIKGFLEESHFQNKAILTTQNANALEFDLGVGIIDELDSENFIFTVSFMYKNLKFSDTINDYINIISGHVKIEGIDADFGMSFLASSLFNMVTDESGDLTSSYYDKKMERIVSEQITNYTSLFLQQAAYLHYMSNMIKN